MEERYREQYSNTMAVFTAPPLEPSALQRFAVERNIALLRDRVRGVVNHDETGLFVYGRGGTGKSFQIAAELAQHSRTVRRFSGKLTPRGLFNALAADPDAVHVLEDVERLFRNPDAAGLLRSALWSGATNPSPTAGERIVSWTTRSGTETVTFTGGIILVANSGFPSTAEFEAVKTRMCCLEYEPTDAEMTEMMRQMASQRYVNRDRVLEPEECQEVCDFVLAVCRERGVRPNLRLLQSAFNDRVFDSADLSEYGWKTLVRSRITGEPLTESASARPQSRQARQTDELRLVGELQSEPDVQERVRRWRATTGKSQASYYRRLEQYQNAQATTVPTSTAAEDVVVA